MRPSIRLRLTLWFSIVMAAALTMFGLGVLSLHARWGHAQFDAELADTAGALSRTMQEELGETGNLRRAVQETRLSMEVPGRATAILDPRGQPIAARWNGLSADANAFPIATVGRPLFRTMNQGRDGWRVLTRYESSPAGDYVILVGGPLDQVEQQHRLLARVLQVATPLIVLMTAGLSWWVASSALRPITILAGEAGEITARSTDWRLDVPSSADEVGQLARAFNQLLERLGQSLRMQRSFMADASHELRTPVSVIKTAAEVTLGRETREEGEYREALTVVHQQSERLTRMVEDMLVLARADAEGYPLTRRPLYVDEIVAECVRAAAVVAVARDIRISTHVQPDVSIQGDEDLLRRLVTNLLDNAVQYTPRGGAVAVGLDSDGASVTVTVVDTGPGIPLADRERVFERFVRLDLARSATSGAGLGLPIARWIAEQHGGTLIIEQDSRGGCRFVLRLPTDGGAAADSPAHPAGTHGKT